MDPSRHYRFLEQLYLQAPVVRNIYPGSGITISRGKAVIECPAEVRFHHGGGSLHGSVYFRMLDDAAYFAAASLETEYFLLTADFQLKFLRPISEGLIRAEGQVLQPEDNSRIFKAEAYLYTADGKLAAKGSGRFARSKNRLSALSSEA